MWRFVKYWLLTGMLLLGGLPTVAEEPATPSVESTKSASENTDSDNNDTAENSTPNPGPRGSKAPEFDPSEQISEDLSVPFPVDI